MIRQEQVVLQVNLERMEQVVQVVSQGLQVHLELLVAQLHLVLLVRVVSLEQQVLLVHRD